MDNISFGNAESFTRTLEKLKNKKFNPTRFYNEVKNSLKDSHFHITEDEFIKLIPTAKSTAARNLAEEEEIFGKGSVKGDPIKDAMLLIKKAFGIKSDY